jgi:glycosyltransferase involved in cell wall biosynthesis
VAKDIALALNGIALLERFNPTCVRGPTIILGNPNNELFRLASAVRHTNPILYVTVEGPLNVRPTWMKAFHVVAVSNYVKEKLEEADIPVSMVIHHGVDVMPKLKLSNNRTFGYIAGYMKRKYPLYGIEALKRAGVRLKAITNKTNPFLDALDPILEAYTLPPSAIQEFYYQIAWYLNLSDSEGFGLTPLEACASGTPVIAPEIPPLKEILPSSTLWVRLTGEVWYEQFSFEMIEHFVYDIEHMVKRIEEAKEMGNERYAALSRECVSHGLRYNIFMTYKKFLELWG